MATANEVKKSLDKAYDQLTPKERARVVSREAWRWADVYSRGEDTTGWEQEHLKFIDKYVYSLSPYDYIEYLVEISKLDIAELGRRYFTTYIQGLSREDALIELLFMNLDRRWVTEIMLAPPKVDGTPEWIAHRDEIIHEITILRERKRAIAADIDAIFNSDFWEVRHIERPPRPDIDPEECQTMYEQGFKETGPDPE